MQESENLPVATERLKMPPREPASTGKLNLTNWFAIQSEPNPVEVLNFPKTFLPDQYG